jgi:transposase/transposase IS116/IS110/IS902 family protein
VVARYRQRHAIAGAKSDAADAKLLADVVRVDGHNHRSVSGDSDLVEAVKIVARAHRRLLWARQRQQNALRAALRQFYPAALEAFGNDLAHPDAVTVLAAAPTPAQGRRLTLTRLENLLRKAGRRRGLTARAHALRDALRGQQLTPAALLETAHGVEVAAITAILEAMNTQLATLEAELASRFTDHPDADIVRSQPGLGTLVGARVLGEFGDDHERFADAKARKRYAGTAPITVASGKKIVVRARLRSNRHLADACYWWAFCALSQSPGARALYDARRAKGDSHDQALRALGNRLVGILHGCLRSHTPYDETLAWPASTATTA